MKLCYINLHLHSQALVILNTNLTADYQYSCKTGGYRFITLWPAQVVVAWDNYNAHQMSVLRDRGNESAKSH